MKHKDEIPPSEIRIPTFEIPKKLKKIIRWTTGIPPVFWLISTAILLTVFLIQMPQELWHYFGVRLLARGDLILLVLIFSLVVLSLLWSFGQRIDARIFLYFNRNGQRTPSADWIMLCLTQIGNGLFAMIAALIFYISAHRLLAYTLVLGTLTLWFVVELIKILIHRTRPYIKLKDVRIVGSPAAGRSFPSGHTSQSFFLATILSHYFQMGVTGWIFLYTASLTVGITRLYLGMHYPRDVFGGAVLGIGWGLLGIIMSSYFLGSS